VDGFERRRERKKENIRQAAFELFSAHGVQKVSIAEIAKKAQVSQVTIYNYFGSKDDLMRDVLSVLLDKRLKEDTEAIESDLPFPKKIEAFISERTGDIASLDPDFLESIMSEDPIIRQMAKDFTQNKFIPLMLRLIEKGKEEGYIHHNISNEAILRYINMFRRGKNSDEFLDLKENKQLIKELATLFFYGVMGKPSDKS